MQSLRSCVQRLSSTVRRSTVVNKSLLLEGIEICGSSIHTTSPINDEGKKFRWLGYNKKMFPIQTLEEERRPAYVCHMKSNIKYSPKNMWYVAVLVRGMTVDEAVKQLSFVLKKGAAAVKETILEAQELAVKQHNVEFKSNLWVAESFCTKGVVYKGLRRHAKNRTGEVRYTHCHYFVRLEEGTPPEHYYLPAPKTKQQMLDEWLVQMRKRKITSTL